MKMKSEVQREKRRKEEEKRMCVDVEDWNMRRKDKRN